MTHASCCRVPRLSLSPLPTPGDVAQKCYQGVHLRFIAGIGIPGARRQCCQRLAFRVLVILGSHLIRLPSPNPSGILFVCIGVPLILLAKLRTLRDRLDASDVSARWGFIYEGVAVRAA